MLKCSDLIGKQKPVDNFNNSDGKLIEWEDGFVVKGVLKGKCIILDNIEKALPTVTERLNSLLDSNYLFNQEYFEIPENPENINNKNGKIGIEINKNFHVIATVDENELKKMSPAFINRFMVIYLDDQLSTMDDENKLSLIQILLKKKFLKKKKKIKIEEEIEVFENQEKSNEDNDDKEDQEIEEEDSFLEQFEDEESENNIENNNEKWEEDEIKIISNEILKYYFKNKEKFNIYNLSKMCRIYKILHFQLGKDYLNDILEISYFLSISQERTLELNESIVKIF